MVLFRVARSQKEEEIDLMSSPASKAAVRVFRVCVSAMCVCYVRVFVCVVCVRLFRVLCICVVCLHEDMLGCEYG